LPDGQKQGSLDWQQGEIFPIHTQNSTRYTETFRGLQPATAYTFRVKLIYPMLNVYHWPSDPRRFVFDTLGEDISFSLLCVGRFAFVFVFFSMAYLHAAIWKTIIFLGQ
jgi:hypothetical protein